MFKWEGPAKFSGKALAEMNLDQIANTMFVARQAFFERYPGDWVLTLDLQLLPEKSDPRMGRHHAFGFNTVLSKLTPEQNIKKGLVEIQHFMGHQEFARCVFKAGYAPV